MYNGQTHWGMRRHGWVNNGQTLWEVRRPGYLGTDPLDGEKAWVSRHRLSGWREGLDLCIMERIRWRVIRPWYLYNG